MIGVYVHIPFCVSKCRYCDFCSYTAKNFAEYADAVKKEICLRAPKENTEVNTIYFGGGTPSILPAEYSAGILDEIRKNFRVEPDAEISIECNPASATKEKIAELVSSGFNRFSVGLQCADDEILTLLGRPHNVSDFCDTVSAVRACGVNNVGCDIMLGLPRQTLKILSETLDLIARLNIPHVSAYALKVERGTPFAKMARSGEITLPDDDAAADMYDFTRRELRKNGICRYEVSNFAKKGFECRHNLIYWRLCDYYGFGASAHGFVGKRRYSNVKSLEKYIAKIGGGVLPEVYSKIQSESDLVFDYAMLSLRLDEGLSSDDFKKRFGTDFYEEFPKARAMEKKGILTAKNGRVAVSEGYTYVLNEVLTELLFNDL